MSEQAKPSQQDTYSVKTTAGVKDQINELLRLTGLPSKELFEAMVTNYKIMALQGTEAERTEDVQQVRYHLSRAENLFLNLVQKNQDVKQDYTSRIGQESALHKQITDELQQQKTLAIQERDKSRTEQMEIIEEMKKSNELLVELTDRGRSDRITIDVLTKKTGELEAQVTALPELKAEIEQLQREKVFHQHQLDGLMAESNKHKDMLQQKDKVSQQAQEGHMKDLEQLQKVHRLELDKASTEASRCVLEAINKTNDDYTAKLDYLAQKNDTITTRNQELTERVHVLELQEIGERPARN